MVTPAVPCLRRLARQKSGIIAEDGPDLTAQSHNDAINRNNLSHYSHVDAQQHLLDAPCLATNKQLGACSTQSNKPYNHSSPTTKDIFHDRA
jgi:hypothetical protein